MFISNSIISYLMTWIKLGQELISLYLRLTLSLSGGLQGECAQRRLGKSYMRVFLIQNPANRMILVHLMGWVQRDNTTERTPASLHGCRRTGKPCSTFAATHCSTFFQCTATPIYNVTLNACEIIRCPDCLHN